MTIRDEIDKLPEKPEKPDSAASFDEWSIWFDELLAYDRAHRAMAERLLREWLSAAPMDSEPRASTRAYLAKREAET